VYNDLIFYSCFYKNIINSRFLYRIYNEVNDKCFIMENRHTTIPYVMFTISLLRILILETCSYFITQMIIFLNLVG